jgi:DNA-binding IclR family transcriptional regulator
VAYIEKQPGPRPVTAFTSAATLPTHPTAVGRALLAFAPTGVVEMTIMRGLRPYTQHTVTSPDRFRRALAVARLTRVAVTRWELEMGACGVAVPVFGAGGDVVAAIELTVRDLGKDLQPVLAALSIAARSLSRELAGSSHRAPDSTSTVPTPAVPVPRRPALAEQPRVTV